MASSQVGSRAEEFERLLVLAEESREAGQIESRRALDALADWRAKYNDYGKRMYFSEKQWDWLTDLAGEGDGDGR